MLPAFVLLRKSRTDEEEERKARAEGREYDALKTHRAILCDLAAKDGVTVSHVCSELKSGERLKDRPDFQHLLKIIRALPKPGAILYTIHAERVTRGLLSERGMVQDLFVEKEVLIREPGGWTNLQSADERLLYEVKGALAHHYLGRFKERVALTRQQMIREGRVRAANVPFGYEWDLRTKSPAPHPGRFPILVAVAREALHTSLHVLSSRYGIPVAYLWRALRNPLICGWPAQICRTGPDGKRVDLPRAEWIWPEREGEYPRALTREEWERLQTALQARQRGQGGRSTENHWCRDVVTLNGVSCRCAMAHVPVYHAREGHLYVARTLVHQAVEERLAVLFRGGGLVERIRALERQKPPASPEPGRLNELRAELIALERRAAIVEGERLLAVESAAKAVAREIEAEKRRLSAAIQAPLLSGEEAKRLEEVAVLLAEGFAEWWGEILSDPEKRVLVRLLVEEAAVQCVKVGGRWDRRVTVTLKPWVKEGPASG